MQRRTLPLTPFERIKRHINHFMLLVAIVAIATLILDHGYYVSEESRRFLHWIYYGIITIFVLENIVKLVLAPDKKAFLYDNRIDFAVTASLLLSIPVVARISSVPSVHSHLSRWGITTLLGLYSFVIQAYIVYHILRKGIEFQRAIAYLQINPGRLLIGTFLLIVTIGTALLFAPRATASGAQPKLIDAVFTATSATCVTGLVVQDTGSFFSPFGQAVILCLIQIGGLGLMTFTAFFSTIIGGMGLREKALVQEVYDYRLPFTLGRMLASILLLTFIWEFLGAALLFPVWDDPGLSLSRRAYLSGFHSVSAFCNAGFSLFPENLQGYVSNLPINLIVPCLIIFGGLGFQVHYNLLNALKDRFSGLAHRSRKLPTLNRHEASRLTLHSKVVLLTTLILLLGGTVLIFSLECTNTLRPLSLGSKLLASFFQSVTPRTAGFNTLPVGEMRESTRWLTMFLMTIGASPGSTGGGMKTSTLAVLILVTLTALRNQRTPRVFRRTLAPESIQQAFVVSSLYLCFAFASCLALTAIENLPIQHTLFEVLSAQGTVGLSTGITPYLSSASKLLLSATMFFGRLGPLAVVAAVAGRKVAEAYEFPRERVLIG